MNFDLGLFSKKLNEQMGLQEYSLDELHLICKIPKSRIDGLLNADFTPTGDEILILSDVFKIDYAYFISNESKSQFEKTQKFYRSTEGIISRFEKRVIAETLLLAEFASDIAKINGLHTRRFSPHITTDDHFKQGKQAAEQLRALFDLKYNQVNINPFRIVREMGIQVFRRRLSNSNISGIHINNANTGRVILINYDDDIYRQNFSLLHELAHCIFDSTDDYLISMESDKNNKNKKKSEQRANQFASDFLIPPTLAKRIIGTWRTDNDFIQIANDFRVNPVTLAYSLKNNFLISDVETDHLKNLKIKSSDKVDPELVGLSVNSMQRIALLQQKGISYSFIKMAHDAYTSGIISFPKFCEVLYMTSDEMFEIMHDIGWVI